LKTFIITEKPSVANDFARALGIKGNRNGYIRDQNTVVTWAIGHLVELFEPEDYDQKFRKWDLNNLPILPENFKYKPKSETIKQLNIITNLLNNEKFDKVIIATDAGREGEVIARTILHHAGYKSDKNLYRFWTSQALTPDVVKQGMKSYKPASEYDRLWKAGHCRQIADWLVGMNGSRAATIKMNNLFSVGRVQTAVLALIVDRKRERENFKPETYWLIKAFFSNKKGSWWGLWFNKETNRFKDEKLVSEMIAKLENKDGVVKSVKNQKKNQAPPLLYSLTNLQQDANKKFGFSAQKTLDLAQSLYETKKCLSYPRTDSNVLGTDNISLTKQIVNNLSQVYEDLFKGIKYELIDKKNKRVFNDKKLTDHHALIPLSPCPSNTSSDERKIYNMVLKRFAAAFWPDCIYQQTEIITEVENENFKTRGKIILDPGWQTIYEKDEKKKIEEDEQENLPNLRKGDSAKIEELKPEKKKTSPPPEYSEALLLKDMTNPGKYVSLDDLKKVYRGDVGLGTQATRAQIIETLLFRKYIERDKRFLRATDKGSLLIDTLRQLNVAKILTSPEETARWEQQLELISRGKGSDKNFMNNIKDFVCKTVEEFKNTSNKNLINRNFGKCPNCGGEIIEGNRGYGCSNWREKDGACRFVIWKKIADRIITPDMLKTLLNNKKAGPYNGFKSNDNSSYCAFLKLIKENDKWIVDLEPSKNITKKSKKELGTCPECGGNIVEREKGYGCENFLYDKGGCRFIIWKEIAKNKIEKKHVHDLLEFGTTDKIDSFISKKGSSFSARLILKHIEGQIKVAFEFN